MISNSAHGLQCRAGGFHIDPSQGVELALITHAHGDHARRGSNKYLCAAPGADLLRQRLGKAANIQSLPYGEKTRLRDVTVSFHPAGHILGSAQIRIENTQGEVWVVSGDYKRDEDPTCAPFEVVPCDTFITEATFGLPVFQWKPAREVTLEILEWWRENSTQGINSLLYCYALGKAQRVLAELARHPLDLPIFIHESIEPLNACYHAQEVTLAPSRTLSSQSHGVAIFGALILIPPGFAGTPIIRRLGEHKTGFASGWMSTRQSMMGRQYDRSFTLSDHADWPSLLRTVRETGARRVYVMHGDDEALIKSLRETGVDAQPISALRD